MTMVIHNIQNVDNVATMHTNKGNNSKTCVAQGLVPFSIVTARSTTWAAHLSRRLTLSVSATLLQCNCLHTRAFVSSAAFLHTSLAVCNLGLQLYNT
jgi:hypothetical protein